MSGIGIMYEMSEVIKVTTTDELETKMVGKKFAETLKGGEFIELIGDLGAGKTAFVKGLALGLDSKDAVSSPSFALKNVYSGRFELQHFDLYRLEDPGLMINEIKEAAEDPEAITVVEWGGIAENSMPNNRYKIKFSTKSENERILELEFPKL